MHIQFVTIDKIASRYNHILTLLSKDDDYVIFYHEIHRFFYGIYLHIERGIGIINRTDVRQTGKKNEHAAQTLYLQSIARIFDLERCYLIHAHAFHAQLHIVKIVHRKKCFDLANV